MTSDLAEAVTANSQFSRPDEPLAVDQSAEIADALLNLIRTYGYLKSKLANSVDPEVSSRFLLVRLVKDGPRRAKELAESMCADQSTVSRQVAALVKAGLLERKADPDDGRASILVPTELGIEQVQGHFVNRGRAIEPIIADWPEADRGHFLRLIRRYSAALDARRDEVLSAMARGHSLPPVLPPEPGPAAHAQQSPQLHEPPPPHAGIERSN